MYVTYPATIMDDSSSFQDEINEVSYEGMAYVATCMCLHNWGEPERAPHRFTSAIYYGSPMRNFCRLNVEMRIHC